MLLQGLPPCGPQRPWEIFNSRSSQCPGEQVELAAGPRQISLGLGFQNSPGGSPGVGSWCSPLAPPPHGELAARCCLGTRFSFCPILVLAAQTDAAGGEAEGALTACLQVLQGEAGDPGPLTCLRSRSGPGLPKRGTCRGLDFPHSPSSVWTHHSSSGAPRRPSLSLMHCLVCSGHRPSGSRPSVRRPQPGDPSQHLRGPPASPHRHAP